MGKGPTAEDIINGIAKLAKNYQDSQASNEQLELTILSLTKTSKLIEDHKEQEIDEMKNSLQIANVQIDELRAELATITESKHELEGRIETEQKKSAEWQRQFQGLSEDAKEKEREMAEMKKVLENISNETAAANEQYQELMSMQSSMKSVEPQNNLKEQIEALDERRQALALNDESECLVGHNISNLSNLSSVFAEVSEEMKEADLSEYV